MEISFGKLQKIKYFHLGDNGHKLTMVQGMLSKQSTLHFGKCIKSVNHISLPKAALPIIRHSFIQTHTLYAHKGRLGQFWTFCLFLEIHQYHCCCSTTHKWSKNGSLPQSRGLLQIMVPLLQISAPVFFCVSVFYVVLLPDCCMESYICA